jgi:hypothetical protein
VYENRDIPQLQNAKHFRYSGSISISITAVVTLLVDELSPLSLAWHMVGLLVKWRKWEQKRRLAHIQSAIAGAM